MPPEQFGIAQVQYTGSSKHVEMLLQRIEVIGRIADSNVNEADFYKTLNLSWISPELREGDDEIQLAEQDKLPLLLKPNQIRGDLHLHTVWSDGVQSIQELAEFARKMGYEYIAITDHSRSLSIANGLSIEKLKRQQEEIDRLNQLWRDFHIIAGVEMGIKSIGPAY